MKEGLRILPASQVIKQFSDAFWSGQSLYQNPEFLMVLAPGSSWYAEVSSGQNLTFFPFTGDKWFGKWRIFQVPFCQKFSPFTDNGSIIPDSAMAIWLDFLAKKTWTVRWPVFKASLFEAQKPLLLEEKTNQILSLEKPFEEILNNWKPGRRQALKKSVGLQCRLLDEKSFSRLLQYQFDSEKGKGWRPNKKEMEMIIRLSEHPHFQSHVFRFGVFENEEVLSLVLLVFWNDRYHYLFSTTGNKGFAKDSMTRFFHDFFAQNSSCPLIFDFEGSNLPGVNAFFRSFGAEEEHYMLVLKPLNLFF